MSSDKSQKGSLEKYKELLREANRIEGSDPKNCFDSLLECIQILGELDYIPEEKKYDRYILLQRIRYFENIHSFNSSIDVEKEIESEWQNIDHSMSSSKSDSVIIKDQSSFTTTEHLSVKSASSDYENSSVVSEEIIVTKEIPEVITNVYNDLILKRQVSYENYLAFYKQVNEIINKPFGAIVENQSPVSYFIGDTHGSYDESLIMINYFNKVISKQQNVKIVFIGDYVDRNPYDLENLTLIVAFFILNQENVVLMRGNHEDRIINSQYGFIQNLMDNFIIQDRVVKVYNEIIKLFTYLPVGMVNNLENEDSKIRIFISHGGIPKNLDNPTLAANLNIIKDKINSTVESYNEHDGYMSLLLWGDPKEEIVGFRDDPMTGRSQFGPDAFDEFLKENNLHYMVRAHEKWSNGYHFFFNDRLVSLFSTSFYSGRKIGEAAFLRLSPGVAPKILKVDPVELEQDLSNM